jgi:circadian clock protein KaiC
MTSAKDGSVASTGIPGLDDILRGGFPRNRLYVVQGDPGAGKTTIGLQFLIEGARAGESVLYITLSETVEELRAVAASHGWSLEGVDVFYGGPVDLMPTEDSTLFLSSEIELDETTKPLLRVTEEVNPSRVVIDSLSEIRLLAQNPLRYRRQIMSLKQFFAGRQCTTIVLDDGFHQADGANLQSIAHGILNLEQITPLYGAERRRMRLMKVRGVKFRGGFHDFRIETGGIAVFPRLIAAEHRAAFPEGPISSGIHELDQLLGGGIERGTTSLLLGPSGAGKSTIATVFASAAAARGEHAAIFTFDEGASTLHARSEAIGLPFRQQVRSGVMRVQQVDPAELSPGEFGWLIRRAVENDGARVIVVDSLNGYYNAMPEEKLLSVQLHELFSYLRQRGVAVITTMTQHGFVGPGMDVPVDVSYLADTVLLLRYFETEGEIRKAISVPKKRSGAHESSIRELSMNGGRIRVGPPLREFRGVLTGAPEYLGSAPPLLGRKEEKDAGAAL